MYAQQLLCVELLVDCLLAGSTKEHNAYQWLYIYSTTTDDGLQIYPKYVEVTDEIN